MARREYTKHLEIINKELERENKKLRKLIRREMKIMVFEKLAELIKLIKPNEVKFNVEYVNALNEKGDNSKAILSYQNKIFFIALVGKIAFVATIYLILNKF